jgi:type II secretory pathway component PulM
VAKTKLAFRDTEVQRVIRAANKATGLDPTAVRVDPRTGEITVLFDKAKPMSGSDLDEWMSKHASAVEGH